MSFSRLFPPGRQNPDRAPRGGRRAPVLTLAEAHNLFAHIESTSFRETNLSHVIGEAEIVRRGERIIIQNATGNSISASYLDRPRGWLPL